MARPLFTLLMALLLGAVAAEAYARDAYWHGKRGPIWTHGPDRSRDLSNWYTASPNRGGKMVRPPDGLALFAEGAEQREVWIVERPPDGDITTRIDTVLILRKAPKYEFLIKSRGFFNLEGQGLLTQSANAPRFVLEPGGHMIMSGPARLNASTDQTSAEIEVGRGGFFLFEDISRGGNAKVSNAGEIRFTGSSSAETMDVTVLSSVGSPAPIVNFQGRSTPERATFRVLAGGILNFRSTSGPDGSERITSGTITNSGNVLTGTNTLTVAGHYRHPDRAGALTVEARGRRVGNIFVRGKATLGGALYVTLPRPGQTLPAGVYRIVYARDGVEGRFETLGPSFSNWRLEYDANEARLVVD
ncbi:hypothetical protein [Hansschlegelia zhihuaiae]|uniref:Auto-transporter adhesin head GIN domain-containing protein n=1 Tax=Hansschlegelia zhihuaiae TaxID=405005 RepID=A0A4Q0MJY8_9HYPH|nr:hypothetical protein [Hansschlegelia zhihuaiae]RXF73785.1 hypothetical protein EK403_09380 [Hansschlegelia zhihuaiae]